MLSTDLTVGVLVEDDGRFLVVEERVSGAMVITQPGGHLESGETPAAAAQRETLEESGCRVDVQDLLGVYLWIHPQTRKQFLRIMFSAELLEQRRDQALDSGIDAVHWFSHADFRRRQRDLRTPVVLRCVEDYLAGKRQSQDLLQRLIPLDRNVPAMLATASLV